VAVRLGPAGRLGDDAPPGVDPLLWRAVIVFRLGALLYAGARLIGAHRGYAHPAGGLAVLAVMVGWTALMTLANATERGRRWPALIADLAVCLALTISSLWVQTYHQSHGGTVTLTTTWTAAPMLGLAVRGGPWAGAAGALVLGAGAVVTRQAFTLDTIGSVVLLFLAGTVSGYVVRLAVRAERQLAAAVRLEAATRERERLARGIHDGVLQVLTLVQRRGSEIGGEAAELSRLAAEQEVALRGLVAAPKAGPGGPDADGGPVDLCGLLAVERSSHVTLSAPAGQVPLTPHAARELAAAVRAALDNVVRHAGADTRAWVLVEDLGDEVVVSVRDDGPGIPPGRLDRAAAEGRLGVALSMRGRVKELGGSVRVHSAPGEGTEVELRVPRQPRAGDRRAGG
jgi:signal transduction histidine kinase